MPPTPAQLGYPRRAEEVLDGALGEVRSFFGGETAPFRDTSRARGIELLAAGEPGGSAA